MASRAILRKKKFLLDSVKGPRYTVQGFLCSEHRKSSEIPDPQLRSWPVCSSPSSLPSSEKEDSRFPAKHTIQCSSTKEYAGHHFLGVSGLHFGIPGEFAPSGFRWVTGYARYLKTAAAGQPELEGSNDKNEEPATKQKKEPSPEECDQAFEGLSSVKAKAKAKKLQDSQKGVNFILKKIWAVLLGIGPALRAVASMNR